MATFVSADWVEEHILKTGGGSGYLLIDPRSAMRYLMGHLRGAVSVPLKKLQDEQGRLRQPDELAGFRRRRAGRRRDSRAVRRLRTGATQPCTPGYWSTWAATTSTSWTCSMTTGRSRAARCCTGRCLQRPETSLLNVRAAVRASVDDAAEPRQRQAAGHPLRRGIPGRSGDRPAARPHPRINPLGLGRTGGRGRSSADRAGKATGRPLSSVGISPDDSVIAYCRSGLRASLPYLAMKQAGLRRAPLRRLLCRVDDERQPRGNLIHLTNAESARERRRVY